MVRTGTRRWRRVGRATCYGLIAVLAFVLSYVLIAELCTWLPRNQDFANNGPILIYVHSNGVHTDLVLPVRSLELDWRTLFEARHFPHSPAVQSADWILLGWGDEGFYLNTPSWSDLKLGTALRALSGNAGTLLHVEYLSEAQRQRYPMHPLWIDAERLRTLTRFVRDSATMDDGEAQSVAGHYSNSDAFFRAKGHYSLLQTCNTWTGAALAQARIQVSAWPPFAHNLMRSLPAPPTDGAPGR